MGSEPVGGEGALTFYERGKAAVDGLQLALTSLETGGSKEVVSEALYVAAQFIPQAAVPLPQASTAELNAQSASVQKELRSRLGRLPDNFIGLPETKPWKTLVDHGKATFEAVFGENFVAMPSFDPPNTNEIERSFEARNTLLDGDERQPDKYLQRLMRARPRLGKYRKLNLYARSLGLPRPRIDVLQLPHVPGEKWLGLPYGEDAPEEGRVATLLLNYSDGLDPAEPWSGLVVDDWTEIIPRRHEETGIALHYQGPQNQAPQAVLVATPSGASAQWQYEELIASIEQTIDLSKIRLLNHEYLDVGQVLPASVFAENPNITNTVSTTLGPVYRLPISKALLDG